MIITVVRHLEPVPLYPNVNAGFDIDRPLSDAGKASGDDLLRNVLAAGKDVPSIGYDGVYGNGYVSPYARCRQTAALLTSATHHPFRWYEVPELRESAHAPQVSRLRNKLLVGEESTFELRDRVARFMSMMHDPVFPALVVTHGDVVNAFRWVIEGLTLAEYRALYDDPDNFVPFGCAWTFDTAKRTAERRLLGDTEPDVVREIRNRFAHGSDSYRLTLAELEDV